MNLQNIMHCCRILLRTLISYKVVTTNTCIIYLGYLKVSLSQNNQFINNSSHTYIEFQDALGILKKKSSKWGKVYKSSAW